MATAVDSPAAPVAPAPAARVIALVADAVRRSRRSGRPQLVSWQAAPAAEDPVELWERARSVCDRAFLWRSAWGGPAVVGAGTAADLPAWGGRRFEVLRGAWSELADPAHRVGEPDAVPLLVGGFAFRDQDHRTDEHPFPDALMWVPAVQYRRDGEGPARLVCNVLVTEDTDPVTVVRSRRALVAALAAPVSEPAAAGGQGTAVEVPSGAAFRDMVGHAVRDIRSGDFDKVVLARRLQSRAEQPVSPGPALRRLRDAYPDATLFAAHRSRRGTDHCFLGATPEYLVRVTPDGVLRTVGLAGSAPRGADAAHDACLADQLLHDAKTLHEHQVVTDSILATLDGVCADILAAPGPRVLKLANIQHLCSPIEGRLLTPHRAAALDLVGLLHPTPALGGHPAGIALDWLRAHEGMDRGWYAGPVGWVDADGAAEFGVAIRSARVDGATTTLYAGAGIVDGSDPRSEYEETRVKFRTMATALGVPLD
ncbi:isochorismate synthase [Streptomyces sp. TR1341]|uniref:isochorismate synthase n=1 Tax=Streptomyces sp. TR1341 TaxID=2601266 RepID=UPI00138B1996|nr:isochorismate synthase [Streptomyces sp. TR1341]